MAKSKWDNKVPFTKEGDVLSCVRGHGDHWAQADSPVWKDNHVFAAKLTYVEGANNRLFFQDEEGHTYPMFVSELGRSLRWTQVLGDEFTGRWTFRRGGQNFSLRVAPPLPCWRCEEVPKVDEQGFIYHRCSSEFKLPRKHITVWDSVTKDSAKWLKRQKR